MEECGPLGRGRRRDGRINLMVGEDGAVSREIRPCHQSHQTTSSQEEEEEENRMRRRGVLGL